MMCIIYQSPILELTTSIWLVQEQAEFNRFIFAELAFVIKSFLYQTNKKITATISYKFGYLI